MEDRVFIVRTMHCSACAAAVERAIKKLPECESAFVNFAAGEVTVKGKVSDEAVLRAIANAGFTGERRADFSFQTSPDEKAENERKQRRHELWIAWFFGFWVVTGALLSHCENSFQNGLLQLLLLIPVLIAGKRFFLSGLPALFKGCPDMDSLIASGVAAACFYSIWNLFKGGHLFFDSSAMILMLVMLGKYLESSSRSKATGAIRELAALAPENALVLQKDGTTAEIPLVSVHPGMKLKVLPGMHIPADGKVLSGSGSCDEAMLTGESLPVLKTPGSPLHAGAVNLDSLLIMEALQTGNDTMLGRIIALVRDAQGSRAPIARLADKVSGWFVWGVLGAALITFSGWFFAGAGVERALSYALGVLVVACPCSLGLATPIALIVGIGRGAHCGILIRNGAALELLEKVKLIFFDKTGTLTDGKFQLKELIPAPGETHTPEELLAIAAALESASSHPLAKAICSAAAEKGLTIPEIKNPQNTPGRGVSGFFRGIFCELCKPESGEKQELQTAVELQIDRRKAALFRLEDRAKPDAPAAVAALQKAGIRCVMLTGDNPGSASRIAKSCGITEFYASLLPQEKPVLIHAMRKGKLFTAMVGDGINDAPALASADIGIALGSGSAAAIETADVILPSNQLSAVVAAVALSKAVMRIIRQNLFWAFAYNIAGIPFAAGVAAALTGYGTIPPAFCAAAMGCSSLTVVLNALRLRRFRFELKMSEPDQEHIQHCSQQNG